MEIKFPAVVLDRGPHKGKTVFGKEIAGRVGSLRFSTRAQALEVANKLEAKYQVSTWILTEIKEVFRNGVTGPGSVFWVEII
jgi:hypothetical protein